MGENGLDGLNGKLGQWISAVTRAVTLAGILGMFAFVINESRDSATLNTELKFLRNDVGEIKEKFSDIQSRMNSLYTDADAARDMLHMRNMLADHEQRLRQLESRRQPIP